MKALQKQRQLYFLGYYGAGPEELAGIWGLKSRAATLEYQHDAGLEADGIFGAHTAARTKEEISALQRLLGVAPDGLAGPVTEGATAEFQRRQGLEPTGRMDDATRAALEAEKEDFWADIRYFTREELRCKCGGRYCSGFPAEPREAAVRVADRARAHFGRPGHNVSFLRCREWNRLQGGVANSQHMYGEAMDLRIEGVSAGELYSFLRKQPEVRYTYEINGTNVHFDIHPTEGRS